MLLLRALHAWPSGNQGVTQQLLGIRQPRQTMHHALASNSVSADSVKCIALHAAHNCSSLVDSDSMNMCMRMQKQQLLVVCGKSSACLEWTSQQANNHKLISGHLQIAALHANCCGVAVCT
eukprot:GHRR01037020.1.p3 GENE.GHRR01037020.1~~GHRR01037020.1.p3  ORF type:complete len:121 (+),score=43.68 GHRR01037020.1:248-610(+)